MEAHLFVLSINTFPDLEPLLFMCLEQIKACVAWFETPAPETNFPRKGRLWRLSLRLQTNSRRWEEAGSTQSGLFITQKPPVSRGARIQLEEDAREFTCRGEITEHLPTSAARSLQLPQTSLRILFPIQLHSFPKLLLMQEMDVAFAPELPCCISALPSFNCPVSRS